MLSRFIRVIFPRYVAMFFLYSILRKQVDFGVKIYFMHEKFLPLGSHFDFSILAVFTLF